MEPLSQLDKILLEEIEVRRKDLVKEIQRIKDELSAVDSDIEPTPQKANLQSESNKLNLLKQGIKTFNVDPLKGISYLFENNILINGDASSVAEFLFSTKGLNKVSIGAYLGGGNEFNVEVLNKFGQLFDFGSKHLDQALRLFLQSFRLPGEAQKIDRMMECFATQYCSCNPDVFMHTDTCYILSFAIIMLNTSLHNPAVKQKPSLENFISMNRGIDKGKDVDICLLEHLYNSIKNEEFKLPSDEDAIDNLFFQPDREGWLLKQGGRVKTWKKRWFVLSENCLYYFGKVTDKEPKGIIPLENLRIRQVSDRTKLHCFELSLSGDDPTLHTIKAAKTDPEGGVTIGNHSKYLMSAPTYQDCLDWIAAICRCMSKDPYYEMLAARKMRARANI